MNDLKEIITVALSEEEKIRLYLRENSLACPGAIASHLGISVNTVTKLLRPNGFPKAWTKEIVENILNDIVWKSGRGVAIADLKNHKGEPNTPLWKAFHFYGFSSLYPLENYRKKFHRMIYILFGMEMPKNYEEEREIEWPKIETLHKRYHSLMRLHHPDQYNQNYIRAKVATINSQLIADAYQKILKRKKWIVIGAPPPINRKEMAIHSKRKII